MKKMKVKVAKTKQDASTFKAETDLLSNDDASFKSRKRKQPKSVNLNDEIPSKRSLDIVANNEDQFHSSIPDNHKKKSLNQKKNKTFHEIPDGEDQIDTSKPADHKEASLNQKKKKKKKKNKLKEQDTSLSKEKIDNEDRCISYLKQWKTDRSTWKFKKLRQIWLNENILDPSKVPDEVFPIWVEYMNGGTGVAKTTIVAKAMKTIQELEEKGGEINLEDLKYQRAKMIVQSIIEK